jgi:hypothetical protein
MALLRISMVAAAGAGFVAGFAAGAGVMALRLGEQPISTAAGYGAADLAVTRSQAHRNGSV